MSNSAATPVIAGLVTGAMFLVALAAGPGYTSSTSSSAYYDTAADSKGESALLLVNQCSVANRAEYTGQQPAIMERTWISVSRLEVQPYSLDERTPCTIVTSSLLSDIPRLNQALVGAEGCIDGSEVCSISYGLSSTAIYPNGIAVDDSRDYEVSLAKDEAKTMIDSISFARNLAILVHNDRFYLVGFHTTNDNDMGAQIESALSGPVQIEPVRIEKGQNLTYTIRIKAFATYGAPASISLEAYPSSRDSNLSVKLEPSSLLMNESSQADVKLTIAASSDTREGVYGISVIGRINNSSLFPDACGLGENCPVIQVGNSNWQISTYGSDSGVWMGGKDPPDWLSVKIETDKEVYKRNENIAIKAFVINDGNETVKFDYPSLFLQMLNKTTGSNVYTFDVMNNHPIIIEPHSTLLLAREFNWDQNSFTGGTKLFKVNAGGYALDLLLRGNEGRVFHASRDIIILDTDIPDNS